MKYLLYSGAGNIFALLKEPVSSEEAVLLCKTSLADGVIFGYEDRIQIFNRDGSEAEMCGNGLRCFIKFLIEQNIYRKRYEIKTLAGTHTAWIDGDRVCVALSPPKDFQWNLHIGSYTLHYLNSGVPHAVLFVKSVDDVDLTVLGPEIRYHPLFPKGVNVNVVEPDTLRVRTYERGVEAETLACGTGASAAALATAKLFNLSSPLNMHVQSGEILKISFSPDWKTVVMEGPANRVGEGTFCLKKDKSPIYYSHYE